MTSYVYPLSEEISLSKALNITLDNPRTEEEIEAVSRYIRRAYEKPSAFNFPVRSEKDIITLESLIMRVCDNLPHKDSVSEMLYKSLDTDNVYELMARIWIVARYDDEGQIEEANLFQQEMRNKGEKGFLLFDDDNPVLKNSRQLVDYSYLISLLIHTQGDEYVGRSFILDSDPSQFGECESNTQLCMQFMMVAFLADMDEESVIGEDLRWIFFPFAKHSLKDVTALLDSVLEEPHMEKLLYVASLLRTVGEDVSDEKVKLVMLVSIVELLLTHSPDFNRFNIEDSISKQFRLKATLLIYLNDKSRNPEQVKSRLKTIYNLRSNIAHGNFASVSRFVSRLSKTEGEEEYFSDLITDLYAYIRAIMSEYLKDPALVTFLKEN